MSLFSTSFSFDAPSSRPDSLYTYETPSDSISPTSSRCTSPSSPSTTTNSSTDDLFSLTAHLSSTSLPTQSFLRGRRSPPRSTPFALPPSCSSQPSSTPLFTDLLARRERRQAYTAEQMSGSNRRKLSLLVARMLGDELPSMAGSRRHPNDGLHPSNVRVVPPMPSSAMSSRRNTVVEHMLDDEDEGESMMEGGGHVMQSIEMEMPIRTRESSNRISKRSTGKKSRGGKR